MAEAKEYVEKALAVMGEDYNQLMERAFNERWIDYAPNKGKSTGHSAQVRMVAILIF